MKLNNTFGTGGLRDCIEFRYMGVDNGYMVNSSCRTVESESYRDYESVFIIPGTSVDTNRKRQLSAVPLYVATVA